MKGDMNMKKIVAILLLLVMVVGLASCGKEQPAPEVEGYQIVSVESDPFYLYVPNTWTSNASSGISSAYYSNTGNIMVSAFFTKNEEPLLAMYTARVLEKFQGSLEEFKTESELRDFTVGGNAAYTFDYSAKVGGKDQTFRTYIIDCEGGYTHLTYSADSSVFDNQLIAFEQIVTKFIFKGQSSSSGGNNTAQGTDVIDGWQLASDDKYEFDFFVPKSWKVEKNGDIPTATIISENGDGSNVTMMSYVITTPGMTAEEYWEQAKQQLVYDYEVISTDDKATLGGLPAYAVEYRTGLVNMNYRVKQVFCATSNMVYVFTYTSDDTFYASHMNSVEAMLEMFLFN